MTRRLILTGPDDRPIFNILYSGFLSGGDPQQQKGKKEVIYQLARIKRVLLAVSEAVPDAESQKAKGVPIRLKDGEQILVLEQRDLTLLEQHICRTEWLVVAADIVADTLDRLSAAEEVKD